MPRRAASARRIKKHLNYTVEEAADVTGFHPHTIRRWINSKALAAITERRPHLIPGRFLIAFLTALRPGKTRLKPGECYCVKCRLPRRPAFDEADYRPANALIGSLQGLCPDCGRLMNRRVTLAKLPLVTGGLHVTIQYGERHLEGRINPTQMLTPEIDDMTRSKHCAENERAKRRHLHWLRETQGYSPATVQMAAAAIFRFEECSGFRDFKRFHVEQARAFKDYLSGKAVGARSGAPLSKATITSTLRHLKAFFLWLTDQPGYRARIRPSDAAYFTPLGQDERIANGVRSKPIPELNEIEAVLQAMPCGTETEQRDRAVIAFIILTGARDRAVASFKLKHVDLAKGIVFQDAREVKTKRAKTFVTKFFPWVVCRLRLSPVGSPSSERPKAMDRMIPSSGHRSPASQRWIAANDQPVETPLADDNTDSRCLPRRLSARRTSVLQPHSFRSTLARLAKRYVEHPRNSKHGAKT